MAIKDKSPQIYIIGGPTASGKSAYAIDLAREKNGEIINGDSMQVYDHLHILTARPKDDEGIFHHLYGVLEGNQIGSLGWWYEKTCEIIQEVQGRGKVPIVVGGTGLYLRALTQGISAMPEVPETIRQEARTLAATLPEEAFYDYVLEKDPRIQGVLHQNDTQRLTRALEVVLATQTSILDIQGNPQKHLSLSYEYHVMTVPRETLYQRINDRFVWMVENGAIQEVEALRSQDITSDSPILKAVGVPELLGYLDGQQTLDQAIILGQQSTRQYAKRQITWFSRQVPNKKDIIP